MKKWLFILSAFSTILVLNACSSSEEKPSQNNINDKDIVNDTPIQEPVVASDFFIGTIHSIDPVGKRAIVFGIIGNGTTDIVVDLSVNKKETFEIGQSVQVGYDGTIMETHPTQINTIYVEIAPNTH